LHLKLPQEQTQELVDKFIRDNLKQTEPTIFTIDKTKYKSLENSVTIVQALSKFKTWYNHQDVTEKQYLLTTNKLETMILPYFGLDIYLEEVTLEDVEAFREFLSTFPNTNKKKYGGLDFKEIIKLTNTPIEDRIGRSTQIKYLKILKQFFNYLIKANLLNYNPCILLNMPNNMIRNREPFDSTDIKHLFSIFETLDKKNIFIISLHIVG